MSTPTAPRRPTDLVELTPQGPPNGPVLVRLAELIKEGVEDALENGPPELNPKKWELADPDAARPPLAEAVGQAEVAIRDIAAASQSRAAELTHIGGLPVQAIDPAIRIREAEEQLRKTIAHLVGMGIVPVAEALKETSIASERES